MNNVYNKKSELAGKSDSGFDNISIITELSLFDFGLGDKNIFS